MATKSKPIVVVSGVTGRQGGSIAKALLEDGNWNVRGLTRHAGSQRALEFSSKGVEIIAVDWQNKGELASALENCYAFFALTDYWDSSTKENETEIGKGMVDAAKSAGVKHFIWSTLPNVEKLSGGKYKVHHFTNKALVQEYAEKILKGTIYTTYIAPGFYYQNFKTFFSPKMENDTMVFTMPDTKILHSVDVNDMGSAVLSILSHPEEFNGKFVPLFGEQKPLKEYIPPIEAVSDKNFKFVILPWQEYSKCPRHGAAELGEMFGWFDEFGYYGKDFDVNLMKKANPNLKSWKDWLQTSWNLPA